MYKSGIDAEVVKSCTVQHLSDSSALAVRLTSVW